jgi:hypothetical protein
MEDAILTWDSYLTVADRYSFFLDPCRVHLQAAQGGIPEPSKGTRIPARQPLITVGTPKPPQYAAGHQPVRWTLCRCCPFKHTGRDLVSLTHARAYICVCESAHPVMRVESMRRVTRFQPKDELWLLEYYVTKGNGFAAHLNERWEHVTLTNDSGQVVFSFPYGLVSYADLPP